MEQHPNIEQISDNQEKQEISFDQQIVLAKALNNAVDERNEFIQRQGGFDTFAEVGQHTGDMRSIYDNLERAVANARKEFDEKVQDKKEFVQQLKNIGENTLASRIASMFGVSKENIFYRIFKK